MLNRKREAAIPPENHDDLYKRIYMKRVGRAAAIRTVIKHKLGMKV